MSRKTWIVVGVVIAVLAIGIAIGRWWVERASDLASRSGGNLLENGGFEEGWTRDTLWWDPAGGPYVTAFGEIYTPRDWTTWWFNEWPCSGDPNWVTGRPEAKVISLEDGFDDPERVLVGDQAAMAFTFWRCHWMGYLQRVEVELGASYQASVYVHSWYSRCSDRPHDRPYDGDCQTPIDWAHDVVRVGIDPQGGLDPRSESVRWGASAEIYGVYNGRIESPVVRAEGSRITVYLAADASHPLKHNDVYWDHATLQRVVVWEVYLPLVCAE